MKEDKDINEQEELNEVRLEATEVPEEGDAAVVPELVFVVTVVVVVCNIVLE